MRVSQGTSVYQWLLAQNRKKLTVTVLGETNYPKLTGKVGPTIHIRGMSKKADYESAGTPYYSDSYFTLKRTAKGLEGTRYYVGYTTKKRGRKTVVVPCFSTWNVTATRQK